MFNGCSVSDLTFGGTAVPDNIAYRLGIRGAFKKARSNRQSNHNW